MEYSKAYIDIITEEGYETNKIIDFFKLHSQSSLKSYVEFVYENVNYEKNPFRISPFELFLIDDDEPNAWALKMNKLYLITIHLSLFNLIENRIKATVPALKKPTSNALKNLANYANTNVEYLLYQFLTLFTYYHELAHLNQFKHDQAGEISQFEKYMSDNCEFDKVAHAMEIDADYFAGQQVALHVLQYLSKFPSNGRTSVNLESFISLVSSSIFLFFFELMGGWHDIYFQEYDHPHTLIRVSYIVNLISIVATKEIQKENLKISPDKCIIDTLVISHQLLDSKEKDGLNEYVALYMKNQNAIGEYIEDMSAFSKGIDCLIINWYKE